MDAPLKEAVPDTVMAAELDTVDADVDEEVVAAVLNLVSVAVGEIEEVPVLNELGLKDALGTIEDAINRMRLLLESAIT